MAYYQIQKLAKNASDTLRAHAGAVSDLAGEIWRETYTPIIGAAQVDYMLEKFQSAERIYADISINGYTYFTARDIGKDRLIGYCAVVAKEDHLFLSKIYVHRDSRGTGVARSFLDEAQALCRLEYGFDKIRLTVNKQNENAIAVYGKVGFTVVDSVTTDIGGGFYMDDYVMELTITHNNL